MDPKTEQFYSERAEEWASHLPQAHSSRLDGFLSHLQPGACVLDLGCGDGRHAAYMEQNGFEVHAVDGVAKMVELSNQRLNRPAKLMLFEELDAQEEYDAIWANASLLHVYEQDLPEILKRVWRALKPGGWHFASFKGGDGGHRDQFDRYYSFISDKSLRHSYYSAGQWNLFELKSEMGKAYMTAQMPWHNIVAQKELSE